LGKLGAFGYVPAASAKSRPMRKASFKFGWNWKQLHKLETLVEVHQFTRASFNCRQLQTVLFKVGLYMYTSASLLENVRGQLVV